MATAMSLSPQTLEEAHAMALRGHTWHRGRSKVNGRPFYLIPSRTEPNVAHYTTSYGCTCRGFRKRGDCAHSEAARMFEAREAAAVKPRVTLDELLDNHLVSAF